MAETNTIKINPNKPSTLEFEVKISGLGDATPSVRFVIHDIQDSINWTVACKHLDGSKYQASFPAFKQIKYDSRPFSVEVIVDEYFFSPAKGTIDFIGIDDISFKAPQTKRPTVTTSFIVKQDDVHEALLDVVDVPMNTGPDNASRIEKNPTEEDFHKEQSDEPEYPATTIDKIASSAEPGDTNVAMEFDPKQVAMNLVKSKLGSLQTPAVKGTLFSRSANGKTRISGLEDAETKQELADKADKVRKILGSV